MINYRGFPLSNIMVYSMVAQLFNVSVWKCFKLGGIILTVTGFFQWRFVIDHMRERFLIFCTFIGLLVVYYRAYYIFNSEINLFRRVIILSITSKFVNAFFFQLVEQLSLKKGLKIVIPTFNIIEREHRFFIIQLF